MSWDWNNFTKENWEDYRKLIKEKKQINDMCIGYIEAENVRFNVIVKQQDGLNEGDSETHLVLDMFAQYGHNTKEYKKCSLIESTIKNDCTWMEFDEFQKIAEERMRLAILEAKKIYDIRIAENVIKEWKWRRGVTQ